LLGYHTFEPALITKILAAGGVDEAKLEKGHANLGTMHVVTITL
jgi:hypothetical protein